LKDFDEKAAAAKTDDEKKAIEKNKADFIANTPPPNDVDISSLTGAYRTRRFSPIPMSSVGSVSCSILR